MREYGFSLTCILLYKGRIYDSVFIRENTSQQKPVYSHILCCEYFNFLSFKGLTHAYLVKTSVTHDKYLTFFFFEDNHSISAKSAAQILSLNLA